MSNTVSAVGVWFYARSTRRRLYLLRNDSKNPECWSLPGGKSEPGESLFQTLERECTEELGAMPVYTKLMPIEKFTTSDGRFEYNTFVAVIESEFVPELNHEHHGYAWIDSSIIPKPLHKGLWSTVNIEAVQEKLTTIESSFQTSQ
jgi:8-oxo-dGTP pyrophosphatase MutT (NUDIX family)